MTLKVLLLGLFIGCLLGLAWPVQSEITDPEKHWGESEMDTAWLTFENTKDPRGGDFLVRFVSDQCYKCTPITVFRGNETRKIKISSQFKWTITLEYLDPNSVNPVIWSSLYIGFKEYGKYKMHLDLKQTEAEILLVVLAPGSLSILPIIIACSVCLSLAFIYKLIHVLLKQRKQRNDPHAEPLLVTPKLQNKPRLRSLDAFRGLSLFLMVFVNYGGGGYWFFNHSSWNGLTLADLLFPWFMWIMGAAMPFAMAGAEKRKDPKWKQFLGLTQRSLKLVALGLFLNDGHFINYWRIPGVLQRFGLAYFVIGTIYLFLPKLGSRKTRPLLMTESSSSHESQMIVNADVDTMDGRSTEVTTSRERMPSMYGRESQKNMPSCLVDHFSDIFPYLLEYLFVAVLVTIWFCLTFLLPVPGCPKGYLGPGGLSGNKNCTGGAAGYIDRLIFTRRHIYDDPTCRDPGPGDVPSNYLCEAYDPEGLIGNLTSICLCFLGLQAGRIMKTYQTHRARFVRLLAHGLVWAAIGTGLCGASQNTGVLPLNKNLWTFSFVALLGGLAFWLLAICFVLIDWVRIWKGAPFIYVGMNSIVVYMGHEILQDFFPFSWSWKSPGTRTGEFSNHWTATTSNLCGACIWLIIAFILFKKKIFIRV